MSDNKTNVYEPIQKSGETNQALKEAHGCTDVKTEHDTKSLGIDVNVKGVEVKVNADIYTTEETKMDCERADPEELKEQFSDNTQKGIDQTEKRMAFEEAKEELVARIEDHAVNNEYTADGNWWSGLVTDTKVKPVNPDGSEFKPEFNDNGKLMNADQLCVGQETTTLFGQVSLGTDTYCSPRQGMPEVEGNITGDATDVINQDDEVLQALADAGLIDPNEDDKIKQTLENDDASNEIV